MIYLATPYSHPDAAIREQRFKAACCAAAMLMLNGQLVYAPIVYGHPLASYYVPTDWSFWEQHARWHLERCDEVVVFTLDGWDVSVGVQKEIAIAHALQKPVRYYAPLGLRHNSGWPVATQESIGTPGISGWTFNTPIAGLLHPKLVFSSGK